MNLSFQELYNLPERCIYAFLNKKDKKIYIGFTKNLLSALQRNLYLMKYSNHPCKNDVSKIEFEILEYIVTDSDLKLRYEYYSNKYSNDGWGLYRDYKAIDYKVSIDLIDTNVVGGMPSIKCCVKLRRQGYSELIVGIFNSVSDAEVFVSDKYSNGVFNIIYCDNQLTLDFLEKRRE